MVGQTEDDAHEALIKDYVKYFDTIKAKLPPDVLKFADRRNSFVYLNDGNLRSIKSDITRATVEIDIDGNVSEQGRRGWGVITLRYDRVTSLEYIGEDHSRRHYGVGDHLFDEIELVDDCTFKHSMYFAGAVEIAVTFGDFSLSYGELDYS